MLYLTIPHGSETAAPQTNHSAFLIQIVQCIHVHWNLSDILTFNLLHVVSLSMNNVEFLSVIYRLRCLDISLGSYLYICSTMCSQVLHTFMKYSRIDTLRDIITVILWTELHAWNIQDTLQNTLQNINRFILKIRQYVHHFTYMYCKNEIKLTFPVIWLYHIHFLTSTYIVVSLSNKIETYIVIIP